MIVPLFHPRRDDWSEHFAIDGIEIIGQTGTGRATARLLRFNDPERLAVRALLIHNGESPPI